MPDILCHLICADETAKKLNEDVHQIILANKKSYNLGAQGPDLFFYYKPQPWLNSNDMSSNATMIHTESTNSFFIHAANKIKQAIALDPLGFYKSLKKDTTIHKEFAYIAGFLSHYALDTIAHPFIFFFSGMDGGHNHKYFECVVDTLMSDLYNGKKTKLHKTGTAVAINKEEQQLLGLFLSNVIQDTFNKQVAPKDISRSFKDMTSTLKALYDPISLKRSTLKWVDKASKSNGRIITATFPAKYDKSIDFLNIKKATWNHPCDENTIYTYSFLELFNASIKYSDQLITAFSQYIMNTLSQSSFEALLGNKHYDTGLVGHHQMISERVITHFKDIYKV